MINSKCALKAGHHHIPELVFLDEKYVIGVERICHTTFQATLSPIEEVAFTMNTVSKFFRK
jgi:hypothetical protein